MERKIMRITQQIKKAAYKCTTINYYNIALDRNLKL